MTYPVPIKKLPTGAPHFSTFNQYKKNYLPDDLVDFSVNQVWNENTIKIPYKWYSYFILNKKNHLVYLKHCRGENPLITRSLIEKMISGRLNARIPLKNLIKKLTSNEE